MARDYVVIETRQYRGLRNRRWTGRLLLYLSGPRTGSYYGEVWVPQNGKRKREPRSYGQTTELYARKRFCVDVDTAEEACRMAEQAASVTTAPRTIAELCGWYTDEVQPARGDAPNTMRDNRRIFAQCIEYFAERGVVTPDDLVRENRMLDAYALHMSATYAPRTINKRLQRLRAVFRAAHKRNLIAAVPPHWPIRKVPDAPQEEPLTPAEFAALLDRMRNLHKRACTGVSSVYNIVRFLGYTGCRPSDAVALTRDRLHLRECVAEFVQQKTRKLATVALSPPAVDAIRDELARGIDSPLVFTTKRGLPFHLSTISNALIYYCNDIGIRRVTPRTFRQAVVSHLYDMGVDHQMVAAITGHRSAAIESYRRIRRSAAHDAAARFAALMQPETTEQTE